MTELQSIASNPAHSAWVSASAGTGKTRVLTERVLRLLLQGVIPSKILCITFTKAAAAEMATRIHESLRQWTLMSDADLSKTIAELSGEAADTQKLTFARTLFATILDDSEGVRIQTIHSFCQSLLKRFPVEANIAPYFQVIEDRTGAELLNEAKMRLFTHAADTESPLGKALQELTLQFHEMTFDELIKLLIKEHRAMVAMIAAYGSLESACHACKSALQLPDSPISEWMVKQCDLPNTPEPILKEWLQLLLAPDASKTDTDRSIPLQAWLEQSATWRAEHFDTYSRLFFGSKGEPSAPTTLLRKKLQDQHPDIIEALLREQQRIIAISEVQKSATIYACTEAALNVAEALNHHYSQLKQHHGYLDYDDLIHRAGQLLESTEQAAWVLFKLDGGIDHLLVDEAQDTSPTQWQLVSRLAEEFFSGESSRSEIHRTLFVVGDEKQSIYSFQGADPTAFEEMHHHFEQRIQAAKKGWQRVPLIRSFRSTEAVLKVVDDVFSRDSARKGVADSAAPIHHELHRIGEGGCVELWPLVKSPEVESRSVWEPLRDYIDTDSANETLATNIALTIREWLDRQTPLEAKGRPIKPGDIMILVRRRKQLAEALIRQLKRHNIPVSGSDRLMLAEHLAVQDLLALGKFLILPDDDYTLACVLKSPLCGYNEHQLFTLAHGREKHQKLWYALRSSEELKDKATAARLTSLLAQVDYLSPHALFSLALNAPEGRAAFVARMGEEAHDPIDELLSLALQFERSHTPTMQGFIHWMESGSTEIKRDMEQLRDEVRVMTVHGSKGLQAPIVFLPDTTSVPKSRGGSPSLLWDTHESHPVCYCIPSSSYDNQRCSEIRSRQQLDELEEYNRLLYVAMTRAEDRLYICGALGKQKLPEQSWYQLVEDSLKEIGSACEVPAILNTSPDAPPTHLWHYDCAQTKEMMQSRTASSALTLPALPAHILAPVPDEPAPPIPLTPSRDVDDDESAPSPLLAAANKRQTFAMQRGILIHTLLQVLPDIPQSNRAEALDNMLQVYGRGYEEEKLSTIRQSVESILQHPDFAPVFAAGSLAEVPLSGVINNRVISGQIDRLCITSEKILVVDYKTTEKVPSNLKAVPIGYIRQMEGYRRLLESIYPDIPVHCALLWTETLTLMELSEQAYIRLAA